MDQQRKNPYRRPASGGEQRPGLRQLPKDFDDLATGKVERLRRPPRAPEPLQDEREGAVIPGVRNSEARAVYDVRVQRLRQLVAAGNEAELRDGLEEARRLALWRARNVTDFRAFSESVVGATPALAQELAAAAEADGAPAPWPSHAVAIAVRAEAALVAREPAARVQLREVDGALQLALSLPLVDVVKAVDALGEAGHGVSGLRRFLRGGDGERNERGGYPERNYADAGSDRLPRTRESGPFERPEREGRRERSRAPSQGERFEPEVKARVSEPERSADVEHAARALGQDDQDVHVDPADLEIEQVSSDAEVRTDAGPNDETPDDLDVESFSEAGADLDAEDREDGADAPLDDLDDAWNGEEEGDAAASGSLAAASTDSPRQTEGRGEIRRPAPANEGRRDERGPRRDDARGAGRPDFQRGGAPRRDDQRGGRPDFQRGGAPRRDDQRGGRPDFQRGGAPRRDDQRGPGPRNDFPRGGAPRRDDQRGAGARPDFQRGGDSRRDDRRGPPSPRNDFQRGGAPRRDEQRGAGGRPDFQRGGDARRDDRRGPPSPRNDFQRGPDARRTNQPWQPPQRGRDDFDPNARRNDTRGADPRRDNPQRGGADQRWQGPQRGAQRGPDQRTPFARRDDASTSQQRWQGPQRGRDDRQQTGGQQGQPFRGRQDDNAGRKPPKRYKP